MASLRVMVCGDTPDRRPNSRCDQLRASLNLLTAQISSTSMVVCIVIGTLTKLWKLAGYYTRHYVAW
jgi:hypothetical protein